MPIPYDLDLPPSSPNVLEPAMTLADIGRIANSPPAAPEPSLADIGRIASGNLSVDVAGAAPTTREGQIAERDKLAYESTYNPAGPTGNVTNPLNIYQSLQNFAPEGTNPQIKYPEAAPDPQTVSSLVAKYAPYLTNPIGAVAEQLPLGVLQGAASMKKQAYGITALAARDPALAKQAAGFGQFSQQVGDVGDSMAATPVDTLARNVASNVTEMAPILTTDGLAGAGLAAEGIEAGAASKFSLGAMSAAFGMTAAGAGYSDAIEANYPHPGLYALATGAIAAGTALIPGYKGQNVVAKAAEMVESKPWEDYIQETINKYASPQFLQTHGGAMALQGAVQSALQGTLNKATIDPNSSWTSIVTDAFKSAGFGAIMGEGFGALHQHDNNKLAVKFQRFAEQAQAADREANPAQSFQVPSDTASPVPQGSFRMEASEPVAPPDESQGSLRATQAEIQPNASETSAPAPTMPGEVPGVKLPPAVPQPPSLPGEVPTTPLAPAAPLNPGGSLRSLAPELQDKSNAVRESMRAQYEALKAQATPTPEAATVAPETPAPKTSLPEGTLPGKGQTVNLGNQMYVTRNANGEIAVRQQGNDRSLATLKKVNGAVVTKQALLADLQKYNAGKATVNWEFNDKGDGKNPLLIAGRREVAEEATQADPAQFQKDVVTAIGNKTPEAKSISRAIDSGTISPTALRGLVGKETIDKGAGEVAKALKKTVADATKEYLNGNLKERNQEGVLPEIPAELKDEEGNLLPLAVRKALQDREGRAARVLDLLVKQQMVKENVDESSKAQAAGIDRRDTESPRNHEQDPNAIAPVAKSGFTDESVLTQFTDEQVKKWPKETALANEVKEDLLQGDTSRYDEGIAALKKIGLKQADAERWMDSEGLFMAPRHLQPSNRVFSTQLEKELATDKPYGIAITKTGGIPVDALKSRMQKVSEGEYRMLQAMGLDNFLAGKTTITAKLLSDWVAESSHDEAWNYADTLRPPRPDLIFKNPDGTDKVLVTARSYSLDKVGARRETGEPFTYSGKSYAPLSGPSEEAYTPGGAKPATEFRDDFTRSVYENRGLTAPTLDVPIKQLALQTHLPGVSELAQQLLKHEPELASVKLGNVGGALRGSHYDADNNVVKIAIGGFPTPDDLTDATFHEAAHALLVRRMRIMGPGAPEMVELGRLYSQAQALYGTSGEALTAAERRAITYGLKDPDEFMAMGMTDEHFRNFLGNINAEGGNLWQKFKAWVYNVATGRSLYNGNDVVRRLFDKIMDRAPVSNADWKAYRADNTGDRTVLPGAFPAIRTVPEYNEIKNYRSGDLTPEEQEIVTRKALVNNNWILEPDIREILAKSAPESKSMLKSVLGPREAVLTDAGKDAGGTKPSSYADIMADPSLSADDKSGMSLSTMHNILQFEGQALTVDRRFANATTKMVDRLKKIEPAMDDLEAKRKVMSQSIKELVGDFKNRILREKEVSANEDRADTLNRMARMLDQVRGSQTALSKYMDAAAAAVPLNDLLSITNRAELYARIKEALPINEETARRIGASTETMRLASVIMANSNVLREELLNLHLVHDPDTLAAANQLGEDLKTQAKAGNLNNALSHFTGQVSSYATQKERAVALWKSLNSERTKLLNSVARLAGTKNALDAIKQAPSYRALSDRVYGDNKLVKVQRKFGATGELVYTHPLTREPVTISATFAQEGRQENMQKMLDLAVAAKTYLALSGSEKYDPAEAPFWRNFIANSDFELDPTVNLSARKLVPAAYDPYKIVKLGGGYVSIPDHVLQLVGGDLATKAQAALQAYSAVVTQVSHPMVSQAAGIELASQKAADAHNLSVADWNREVLNPLIHSRQQVGYQTLRPGSAAKTIYGHSILPEDEAAFQKQRTLDRAFVDIGLAAHDNPAVAANPARVAFTSPAGDAMTRQIASSGPDTMSRHLGLRASTLASQWFEARTPESKVGFMDDNFIPVVVSHIDAVGAPDYSIKSSQSDIYRAAIKQHQTVPFDSTQELVDFLFDAQAGTRDPEAQHSSQYIKGTLIAELDKAFTKIGDGFKAQSAASDKVKGIANFIGTDNSFTQERGKLIAPPALYDYGLTFEGDRLARAHAAAGYYAMQLVGDGGALDRLTQGLQKTVDSYQSQIRRLTAAGDTVAEAKAKLAQSTETEQLKGKLLVTYAQAEGALREVRGLHEEMKRLLSRPSVTADPVMVQSAAELQAFTTTNLLGGVVSRDKHLFGGISNIMDFNKVVLGRSAFMQALPMAIDTAVHSFKEMGAMASPMSKFLQAAFADTIAEHRRMEQLGLAPTANVAEEMKALLQKPTEAGRSQRTELSPGRKVMKVGETGMRIIAEPLKAYTTRVVDRLLNGLNVDTAYRLENMLRENSVLAGNTRSDMGMRGVFTAQEIFGDTSANPKQEVMLRNLFHKQSLNLDRLMWNYRDSVAEAKAKGEDPNAVQFFTDGQRAALQYTIAQGNNLPTIANRPTSVRGTKGRNIAGQFWGFHLWNASRNSLMLSRVSTDKNTFRYVPQLMSRVVLTAALGATGLMVGNQLKKHLYGETASIPDITEAKNYGDAAGALLNGYAAYTPIIGAAINGIILNKAYGTGFDPTSQFVMLSLVNDVVKTAEKIDQTGSAWNPTMQFLRRWAPLSRIVINQLPSQEGLTDYYNTARDLKNLAPADLASAKRGGGAFDATPATPIMQDMLNAAYRGDTQGFHDASDRYMAYEQMQGKNAQQAEQSLQASFRSHNPYVMAFGRLPTAFEQQQIYSNASDEQRLELQKSAQVFQAFGGLLGIHDVETKDPTQSAGGSLGGGSAIMASNNDSGFLGDSSLRDSGYLSGSPRRAPDDNILSSPASAPAAEGQLVTSQRGLLGSPTDATPGVSRSGIVGGAGLGGGGGGSLRLGGGGHAPTGSGGGAGRSGPRVRQVRASHPRTSLAGGGHASGGSLRAKKIPGLHRH